MVFESYRNYIHHTFIHYDRYYQPSDSHQFIADLYLQIFQEETKLV